MSKTVAMMSAMVVMTGGQEMAKDIGDDPILRSQMYESEMPEWANSEEHTSLDEPELPVE